MIKRKHAAMIGLTAALLVTQAGTAFADNASTSQSAPVPAGNPGTSSVNVKVSKDKAVSLAKQYVSIPDRYTLTSANLDSNQWTGGSKQALWQLQFESKEKQSYYSGIGVAIDADSGRLVRFYSNDYDPTKQAVYPPKTDFAAAKEIANAFLGKFNDGEAKQLSYDTSSEANFKQPLQGEVRYNLRYNRTVNGIDYGQNGVSITVNGDGHVVGYEFNWDTVTIFDDATGVISKEQALKTILEKSKLSLSYLIPYQAKSKTPQIAYEFQSTTLNGKTGEFTGGNGSGNLKPLTDSPLASPPKGGLNLTKEQAAEKASTLVNIPEQAKLEDSSYSEYTNPETGKTQSRWNLRWTLKGATDADTRWLSASIDSDTGELINFNRDGIRIYDAAGSGQQQQQPAISREKAEQLASDFIKKAIPHRTSQLALNQDQNAKAIPQSGPVSSYYLTFARVIDGVKAGYENVNITIDAKTGEIANFYNSISDIEYPEKKPAILDESKAKDLLLERYDLKLMYRQTMDSRYTGIPIEKYNLMIAAGEIPPGSPAPGQPGHAEIVYTLAEKPLDKSVFLDAQSGSWRNAENGEPVKLVKESVTDINGHWAQHELQTMIDYDALDVKNGLVSPNQPITRGEMIKMLLIAMNGGHNGIYYGAERKASFADVTSGSAFFNYVEQAVDQNLVDPASGSSFKPESNIPREELAVLIVRALGYNKLAEHDDLFALKASDSEQIQHKGQVAIVNGLGIMSTNDGAFAPKEEVTRAQAAVAFSRFLHKRAELLDRSGLK